MHEFQVQQVVSGSTTPGLSQHLAGVQAGSKVELIEVSEEVVMTGFRAWNPIAHRPSVDDLVIKHMILVSAGDGGLVGVLLTGITRRGDQDRRGVVHAHAAVGGVVDEGLRINGSVQMIVQVSPFWHRLEERQQQRRLATNGFQIPTDTLFAGSLRLYGCDSSPKSHN